VIHTRVGEARTASVGAQSSRQRSSERARDGFLAHVDDSTGDASLPAFGRTAVGAAESLLTNLLFVTKGASRLATGLLHDAHPHDETCDGTTATRESRSNRTSGSPQGGGATVRKD
jgi:hypothetical protein